MPTLPYQCDEKQERKEQAYVIEVSFPESQSQKYLDTKGGNIEQETGNIHGHGKKRISHGKPF